MGDFNAPPNSVRFNELTELLLEYGIEFHDTKVLPPGSYTHVNHGSLTASWIDHIALSNALSGSVLTCYTLPDVASSDHCVLGARLNLARMQHMAASRQCERQIKWDFANTDRRENFYRILDVALETVPGRLLRAGKDSDIALLDELYGCMRESIIVSGRRAFGLTKKSEFNVPGWNDHIKELHRTVRQAVFNWNIAGRPRGGQLAVTMRVAKSRFRRELRFLRSNEDNLRAQALLTKLQSGDCREFWKEIRSLNP